MFLLKKIECFNEFVLIFLFKNEVKSFRTAFRNLIVLWLRNVVLGASGLRDDLIPVKLYLITQSLLKA